MCFDDCFFNLDYKHYKQRPGTDIKELPAFPFEQVREANANMRLIVIEVYLQAITDYLQHTEDYEKNRRDYQNYRTDLDYTDFSI